jgi:hypothetical protein
MRQSADVVHDSAELSRALYAVSYSRRGGVPVSTIVGAVDPAGLVQPEPEI